MTNPIIKTISAEITTSGNKKYLNVQILFDESIYYEYDKNFDSITLIDNQKKSIITTGQVPIINGNSVNYQIDFSGQSIENSILQLNLSNFKNSNNQASNKKIADYLLNFNGSLVTNGPIEIMPWMECFITNSNVSISQQKYNIKDDEKIVLLGNNVTLTIGNATVVSIYGGNNIIGTTENSNVAYWYCKQPLSINLQKGIAQLGNLGMDNLQNIHTIMLSGQNNNFIGSKDNDTVWLSGGGNNFLTGNGGSDSIKYYNEDIKKYQFSLDNNKSEIVVTKNTDGMIFKDTLVDITKIIFDQTNGQSTTLTPDQISPINIGGFQETSKLLNFSIDPLNYHINSLVVGDFNVDGNADIAVFRLLWISNPISPIQILTGDGKGNFIDASIDIFNGTIPKVNFVARALVRDINGDGYIDLFCVDSGEDVSPWSGGQNKLFLSNGKGQLINSTFLLPQLVQVNHGSSIGDVNGDGKLDLFINPIGFGETNQLYVQRNDGSFINSPEFMPEPITAQDPYGRGTISSTNTWSGLIDINNDGFADLILGRWSNQIQVPSLVYLNDGHGSFAKSKPSYLPKTVFSDDTVCQIVPIDLNGDNLPDLLVSDTNNYLNGYIQFLINVGNGNFIDKTSELYPQQSINGSPTWFKYLNIVDFNHDGYPDIAAIADEADVSTVVLMNDGKGHYFEGFKSPEGYSLGAVSDVNNDGMSDILTATIKGSNLAVWINEMTNKHIYVANFGGDDLIGSSISDQFYSKNGIDNFDGNGGVDTLTLQYNKASYKLTSNGLGFTISDISSLNNVVNIINIERLVFTDSSYAVDLNGNAGIAAKIIGAVFGKEYLSNKQYIGFCLHLLDGGASDVTLATTLLNAANLTTNDEIISTLLRNVLSTTASAADKSSLLNLLNNGASLSDIVLMEANMPANISNINLDGLVKSGLEFSEYKNDMPIEKLSIHLPAGNVTISGNASQNQLLTVFNTLTDEDGLGVISYQWLRDGTVISNAIQSTYTLSQLDVGKKISVKASYVDGFGFSESVSSNPSQSILNVNDIPIGSVIISGSTNIGQILTASNNLTDADGLGSISYTWMKNGIVIPNATQSTYMLTQADTGKSISAMASYVDLQNTAESVSSSDVVITPNLMPTGNAIIKGISTFGSTLSITNTIKDADGIGKLSFTWQNDHGTLSTSPTYTLAQTDISTKVWAVVSYTDKKGNFEEVKSNVIDVTVSTKPSAVNDMLIGTDKADKLNGLTGNDTLIGGMGKDTLTGGTGADVFKFNSVTDSSALPKQADIITDFKHAQGDKIDLSAIDINPSLAGKQSFIPINAQTFSADATGKLTFDAKTSTLYGSTNSDPAAEFAIVFSGVKSLTADDFIL